MSYQVVIAQLGLTLTVKKNQTILDAALRAGIALPYACGSGQCSTCAITLLDGKVRYSSRSIAVILDSKTVRGKCFACCAVPVTDLVIGVELMPADDVPRQVVADYQAVVTKIENKTPRVKSIFLSLEKKGIQFQAGQYINLYIPGSNTRPRAFSIASPPSSQHVIELNVGLVPGGVATEYLHQWLKTGDSIGFSGPYGYFQVQPKAVAPLLFIAEESSLSSAKSMIMDLVELSDPRRCVLLYGAKNQQELFYRELFEEIQRENAHFQYIPVLFDEPSDSGWQGRRGRVDEMIKAGLKFPLANAHVYVSGMPAMTKACVDELIKNGSSPRHIYVENFYNNNLQSSL